MARAVLFDLDDTRFDPRGSSRAALAEVHRRHAATSEFDAFERHHARFLEELHLEVLAGRMALDDARRERFLRVFDALGIRLSQSDVDAVAAAHRARYLPAWPPGHRAPAPPAPPRPPPPRRGGSTNHLEK